MILRNNTKRHLLAYALKYRQAHCLGRYVIAGEEFVNTVGYNITAVSYQSKGPLIHGWFTLHFVVEIEQPSVVSRADIYLIDCGNAHLYKVLSTTAERLRPHY